MMRSFWLILPLLGSCGPSASGITCDTAALPYQYEVVTGGDSYFATLIPLDSGSAHQTFFLSETYGLLTSEEAIRGGDPSGRIVTFERSEEGLVATELGLSFDNAEIQSLASRSAAGVRKFEHEGASYSLRFL